MPTNSLFLAPPRFLPDLSECFFYHSMDVPGYGMQPGQWDLRNGVEDYLGGVDFKNKEVLEIGPASGYLTYYMEGQGAEVTACELPSFDQWDIVPYAGVDPGAYIQDRLAMGKSLRNSFWLAHKARDSSAKLGLSSAYQIPDNWGKFDIATFGSVLLHVRDPFLALQAAAKSTTEIIIITDIISGRETSPEAQALIRPQPGHEPLPPTLQDDLTRIVGGELGRAVPKMHFIPSSQRQEPMDTWWNINPPLLQEFLGILGFKKQFVTYHYQGYDPTFRWLNPEVDGKPVYLAMFTVVGSR